MGSAWLNYRELLLQNASQISSIESVLRSLTYLLPGTSYIGYLGRVVFLGDSQTTWVSVIALINVNYLC
jgi:hypothetical protein